MEQEILLSVIVPVYNRENFLPRCLESLVKQTMEAIEILVVDDGSTDASLSILNSFRKNIRERSDCFVRNMRECRRRATVE